ncbi:MAG: dihydrolipoyl dehydrogenase family protein, partial [Methylocella sp.]
ARRFVIATGSRPTVPAIPGLKDVPYFTNETLYDSKECPDHLIILGGGPIGMEMALAFRRLGSRVTVIEASEPLNKEDPELAAVVLNAMVLEGVEILRKTALESVARNSKGIAAKVAGGRVIEGTHLLVAAGRQPNIEDLNLEAAGIARTEKGVTIDRGLRTTNRKVYAIGDVAGAAQFTHLAACHAGLVVRNALFGLPVNAEAQVIPRVTFTDPELAQAGLTEAEARAIHGDATTILREPFAANDRAQTDGKTEGLIKVVMGKRGRILGVGIVGKGAGEIIQPWILAMSQKLGVKSLVDMVAPYPTRGNLNRGAALKYYASLATNPWVRRVIDVLARFR